MLKIIKSDLEKIAVLESQYPLSDLPEIALAGRSNVGKSSFINSVLTRKKLARTSSKPGKTRTVNFYRVNDKFRIVDLPGYGYAAVSQKEKDKWAEIIDRYLHNRENLDQVFLLVDIRHEPTDLDKMMYDWIINCGFKGYVIANKADKISKARFLQAKKVIALKLEIKDRDLIIPYSSEDGTGKDRILSLFSEILEKNRGE